MPYNISEEYERKVQTLNKKIKSNYVSVKEVKLNQEQLEERKQQLNKWPEIFIPDTYHVYYMHTNNTKMAISYEQYCFLLDKAGWVDKDSLDQEEERKESWRYKYEIK